MVISRICIKVPGNKNKIYVTEDAILFTPNGIAFNVIGDVLHQFTYPEVVYIDARDI